MLRVGLIQLSIIEGNVQENKKHIRDLVTKYSRDEIDLLCFPELCLSGYDFDQADNSLDESEFMAGLAKEYSVSILAGIYLREGDKRYDAVRMWDKNGTLLGTYRKIHLYATERRFFSAGSDLCIIPFKGWNIGILVCADLGFPEVTRILVDSGCDLVIYPSAWARGKGFDELFTNCGRIRAAENQVYTIVLNRGDGDQEYCGYTTVSNPDGTARLFLNVTEETYAKVTLNKDEIRNIREMIPWQMMRQDDLYRKLSHKNDPLN